MNGKIWCFFQKDRKVSLLSVSVGMTNDLPGQDPIVKQRKMCFLSGVRVPKTKDFVENVVRRGGGGKGGRGERGGRGGRGGRN